MLIQDAQPYIEKLGLTRAHNVMGYYVDENSFTLEEAQQTATSALQQFLYQFGPEKVVTAFLLTLHDTAFLAYTADEGIAFSGENFLDVVQEHIREHCSDEGYILFVELEPDHYEMVVNRL